MKSLRILLLISLASYYATACGPAETTDNTTKDTLTTQAPIHFDTTNSQIVVEEEGPVVSSTLISPCTIGFEKVNVSYSLVGSNQDQLQLDLATLSYVRPLSVQPHVAGVPDKIFGVWQQASKEVEGVTFTIQVEIQEKQIVYRNTCVR